MKVFVSRKIFRPVMDFLGENGLEVVVNEYQRKLTQEELIEACQQVDFLLNIGHVPLDDYFFERCSHLKGIALASVGYDHVDIVQASLHHIPVSNTPEVLSKATADIAFLLMQAVARKAFYMSRLIERGGWKDFEFIHDLGVELDGKTLGIYGLGRIGLELARKAKEAFHMDIIYHNRHTNPLAEEIVGARYVGFDELLAASDVLSVHTNLTPETAYRFDEDSFKKMKRTAIFINTARGKIHVEKDLYNAVQQGDIWGAGLDVTDPEPMGADNPLLQLPTVCVLPHIGSATMETRTKMCFTAAQNIVAASRGMPMPQVINKEVYEVP